MASESNSAVLELDSDDKGGGTRSEAGPDDAPPLIMEHGYDIAVKVDVPMKQLSTLETYVTYRVRCVCARWPTPPFVRRRYNHFKALHRRLSAAHPLIAPPPLPPLHSARQQLDRYDPAFVALRTLALGAFLDRVAKHPILTHSEDFRLFLTTPDDELEKVFKAESSALSLWGLGGALSSNDARPPNGARVKDPEFSSASEYLQSLQSKLSALCALTNKLCKGSNALGNELMGMKRCCDAWCSQSRGRLARAPAAVSAGALTAGRARAARPRPAPHAAALPALAAYAQAHVDKIRQRDAVHAAHVAGNNTGELHNRLEQFSEALRSELSDWIPKTHSEIKSLLLDLADSQVKIYTQTLSGWEHALKLSSETNIDEIFKTVSKNAVLNLSPTKNRPDNLTPTETEKDFDDIDYSNDDSDFDDRKFESIASSSRLDVEKLDETSNVDVHVNEKDSKVDSNESIELNGSESKTDSNLSKIDSKESKSDGSKVSDPLQDFSEIDLSS